MIFRELVETELAMGITATSHNPVPALPSPQDYWLNRPLLSSVPPLEESPLCPPRSRTEHSPCGCRGPAQPVKAPPVYPHVEWPSSPSLLLQERPASDTEKQQDSRSSGARTHPFGGYVEVCRSPNKWTLADEASLPVSANAGARPIFHEELTPGHKDAAGGECKVDVEDGHGVQPLYQSGNQSSGQSKTSETTLEQINGPMLLSDQYWLAGQESAAFDQQKCREFSEQKPEQPRLGNGDERKARVHAFNGYMELCLSPSKQAPVEEISVPVAAKADISPMQSALSFGEAAATGPQQAFGGEPKANVVDAHGMQGDIRNQSSGQRKAMESAMEGRTDKPAQPPDQHRPAGQEGYGEECKADAEDGQGVHSLYQSGNQSSGKRKTLETTLADQINGPMLLSDRLAGQESASFDQQKGREFSELKPEQPRLGNEDEQKARLHASNGYMELCLSPSKQAPVEETLVPVAAKANNSPMQSALSFGEAAATGHQRAFGREPKANVVDGHGMQGDIRNDRSRQRKAMESALEGRTDKPARPPGQHRPAGQENAAYNEQKKVEFSESTPERTSNGLKRKLADSAPLIKKQKPYWQFSCPTCGVNTVSQHHLEEHLAGRRHQQNVAALQSSRSHTAEPSTKAKLPVWDRITVKNTESSCGDGKEKVPENSGSQQQGGKPHAKAVRAGLKGFNHRKDADAEKKVDRKDKFYCKLCDVQCNSEKMLLSHLCGKKHRERLLEGRG
ncbi:hypothetical protein SEVIR_2G216900v4 [Setaria viridis]|nr:uncharacterized protein LOC117845293 isoform X2 [Setaria viridis]XP_034582173.1 uncharacterized protein LOC117845293 isoform X2 [Setaria viridis]TKW33197.1 hypothetical protein SEVIR_2G216900v2 [Setaria viridis]TKW33198.1 hypothetical protein SEVIR_2G216900v2 [Setaria viridis]